MGPRASCPAAEKSMFGTVLTTFVTAMHAYVFWRASTVPWVAKRIPRPYLLGAGAFLWCVFFLGRFLRRSELGFLSRSLEAVGMDWMAVLFLAAVCMLAADVLTGFGFLLRRHAPSARGAALLLAGLMSATALVQGRRPPVVRPHEVRLAGLPEELDGTVVVAVADLHVGSRPGVPWLRARVAQVMAEEPDMVVLLGDIFEGHGGDRDGLLEAMKELSAPLGVYAVLGNHESHGIRRGRRSLLEETGFWVLRNVWRKAAQGLVVAGVDDLTSARRRGGGEDYVAEALEGRPAGGTVLLSHTSWRAEEAARLGAGLMLSGHTHGGQIWPFGWLVKRRYPLFAGRYEVDGMTVLVCRGTGTWGPRMRLWHPNEMLRVTLRSE